MAHDRIAAVAAAALFGVFGGACSDANPRHARPAPSAVYVTRGIIEQLPDPAKPAAQFMVHHEAIDNYANADGRVVGMGSMVMEFPPEKGISLSGLRVGDKVELTFAVWWGRPSRWAATNVVKLPDTTTLEFRRAKPPSIPSGN
ncbi:MAG: copper-binding protein [Phycisphaerae bacterium]|nr:copper-binding protein [Phycisphaerae bacterium]